MHNLYAEYVKILDICKQFSKNPVNEQGNVPRRGVVPKLFADCDDSKYTGSSLQIESEGLETDFHPFCKGQKAYRNGFLPVCGAVHAEPELRQTATGTVCQSHR